ncbi:NUDIX domain-containing protein [Tsukamurella sputi]|uniref:NUDIX domain-containing protein n=1 Tax=Tsukamurella sputi TaxID=2591848 RepID=A0A5C5RHW4_9ACTN|nr:NUDIX hydrolase [Tsukamurella sputi]TWS22318.1 NUDIX domain-containing protein [Tsukamurella sputi]
MTSAESADTPGRPQRPGPVGDSAAGAPSRPRRRRRRGGRGRGRGQLSAVTDQKAAPESGEAPSEPAPTAKPARKQGTPTSKAKRPTPGRVRPDPRIRTVRETSAGGLVVAGLDGGDELRAALIGRVDRRGRTLWSLPKGHIETGETAELTAIREVAEETGLTGSVLAPIGKIDYWFAVEGRRVHKTVHHFLLSWQSGDLSTEDYEVSEVAWVPLSELTTRLTYSDERKLVATARTVIEDLTADPEELAARVAAAPRSEPSAYERAAAERNAVRNDPPKPRRRRGGRRSRGRRSGGGGGSGQT